MKKYILIHKLCAIYAYFLLLFLSLRIFFIIYNYKYLSVTKPSDWLAIFVVGIRFDAATISLFMLGLLAPITILLITRNIIAYVFTALYLHLTALFFIVINCADTAYFPFNFRRSTVESISMLLDVRSHLISILSNFPIALICTFLFISLHFLYFYKSKIFQLKYLHHSRNLKMVTTIIFVALIHAGIIRGFNPFPLTPTSVGLYTNPNYTPMVCNTFQTLFYSLYTKAQSLVYKEYLPPSQAKSSCSIYHQLSNKSAFQRRNVVIFILESFSRQYLENGNPYRASTPFLDSIMDNSLVCTNAFANGSISLNGVQNILSGIPPIEAASMIGSNYAQNKVVALPEILKNKGYKTMFFHGAEDDLFGLKRLTKKFGIDQYYSEKNLPTTANQRCTWGIHDQYFFDYSLSVLNQQDTPFMASIFNISSHDPYDIPFNFKNKLPKGKIKAQQSISYVDFCLDQFFSKAEQKEWFFNTLFIFVADHWNKTDETSAITTGIDRYKIPLFFYAPYSQTIKGKYKHVIDQNSVFPSVMDLLDYTGKICSFGKSVKDTSNRKVFLMYQHPNVFQVINDELALQFDYLNQKVVAVENYKNNLNIDSLQIKKMTTDVQAFIQVYTDAVINNKLTAE
jgi:phosphoglycerol transferase MdoB-like AlkP superfamily enzyme